MSGYDQINQILKEKFDLDNEVLQGLTDDTHLLESGLLDSFGFLHLIMQLEQLSGVLFDFEQTPPDTLTSYGALARHIADS